MEDKLTLRTSYFEAVHWCNNALILCNEIPNIDPSIWDNCEFDMYDENDNPIDIFQFFLTDCSQDDVRFLQEHFSDMLFTYSDMLDLYVLCVDHFGTMWKGVPVYTDLEMAAKRAEKDLY